LGPRGFAQGFAPLPPWIAATLRPVQSAGGVLPARSQWAVRRRAGGQKTRMIPDRPSMVCTRFRGWPAEDFGTLVETVEQCAHAAPLVEATRPWPPCDESPFWMHELQ